jgi:hypothetical protein
MIDNPNDVYPSPFPGANLDFQNNGKLNEDTYEVYVNEDFVGHKTLKNAGENLSDVDDFLRIQGIHNFSTSLDGDHYFIKSNDNVEKVKNALSVYFQNR